MLRCRTTITSVTETMYHKCILTYDISPYIKPHIKHKFTHIKSSPYTLTVLFFLSTTWSVPRTLVFVFSFLRVLPPFDVGNSTLPSIFLKSLFFRFLKTHLFTHFMGDISYSPNTLFTLSQPYPSNRPLLLNKSS